LTNIFPREVVDVVVVVVVVVLSKTLLRTPCSFTWGTWKMVVVGLPPPNLSFPTIRLLSNGRGLTMSLSRNAVVLSAMMIEVIVPRIANRKVMGEEDKFS